MSLKTIWKFIDFKRQNHFAWVFEGGKMFTINDSKYTRVLKENYLNKKKFYEGTKIKKEKN